MKSANPKPSRRRPVTCTELGCADESNGIKPFDKCPTHYRLYTEFVARRDWLEAVIARCVERSQMASVLAELMSYEFEFEPLFIAPSASRDAEVAGALMDEIAVRAEQSSRSAWRPADVTRGRS